MRREFIESSFEYFEDKGMKLRKVSFRIESGYVWGSGMSNEKYEQFDNEIRLLFTEAGFGIIEGNSMSHCPYFTKGKTKLYVHPESLSGCCEESQINEINEILSKGKTFRYIHTDIYEELFDMNEEQELAYYQSKYEFSIQKTLTEAFCTKRRNLFHESMPLIRRLASSIRINTTSNATGGISDSDPNFRYVIGEYRNMVDRGLLIETIKDTPFGGMKLCRSVTN
jgi:hypothetical protein